MTQQNSYRPTVLVIDDEHSILETIKEILEDDFFIVITADNPQFIDKLIQKHTPDVILLDIFMPGYDGLEVLDAVKKTVPSQDIIIMSGYGTIDLAVQAVKRGARDFIEKPISLETLYAKIEFTKKQQSHIASSNSIDIIGASSLFNEFLRYVQIVSTLKRPALIEGPAGSGKKLYAEYIHTLRSAKKVTTINAQLFSSPRNVEALTIIDIDDAPLAKQEEIFAWLTQNTTTSVVCSTKKPLFNLVRNDQFIPDLYVVLSSCPIQIPALRLRSYDIGLLAFSFLKKANIHFNKSIFLTAQTLKLLKAYTWPGDVQELKEIIYSLVESAPNQRGALSAELLEHLLYNEEAEILELNKATEIFQKSYLQRLVIKKGYNLQALAHELHIPFSELYDRMVKLQIL